MDTTIQSTDENIREIEDIINIQKANGSFNARQVAFVLPLEQSDAAAAAVPGSGPGLARSLESGLTRTARVRVRGKKRRGKGRKAAPTDNVSWPSDSDITVLRMKAGAGAGAARRESDVAGDGLHHPDGCSMVNLATLVLPEQSASKHSLAQELLLPLSSWERPPEPAPTPAPAPALPGSEPTAKSRVARFLRLYFCPCCTCLYEMERNLRDEPSVYLTAPRTRTSLAAACADYY